MKYKLLTDLTNEEIKEILTDIFEAVKISCIKRRKKDDEIDLKIYIKWTAYDDDGNKESFIGCDEITLKNPFDCSWEDVIVGNVAQGREDVFAFEQYCFAKGVVARAMITNNKWLGKEVIEE